MRNAVFFVTATLLISASAFAAPKSKVVVASDIEWGYLNPLRGALSPGAANLWGDRTADQATGMLVRFNKGFESPPHIHNINYRGVVIDGLLHNDDPTSEKMWMPTGSFWTQPAGEVHTTAANGKNNLIYLEIDSGPYLVKPSDMAFDNGERPVNLHTNNIVWLGREDSSHLNAPGVEQTFVWGDPAQLSGSMIKLSAGFDGSINTKANEFRAVVISGQVKYDSKDSPELVLAPGSYLESTGDFIHQIKNMGEDDAVVYVRTSEPYSVDD